MKLLLVGDDRDLSAAYVGWLARARGAETVVLAEDRFGLDWWFETDELSRPHELVFAEEASIAVEEIGGVFVRLNPNPAVPSHLDHLTDVIPIFVAERRYGLHYLLDHIDVPVVNRPSSGRSNGSKPFQMDALQRFGFRVPDWIVSNDASAVASFAQGWREGAIYKSPSGLRSHVKRVDEVLLQRLGNSTSPVLVQRFIPGHDVRLHVVGSRCFATAIRSPAVDYRFEPDSTVYEGIQAPPEIEEACRAFTKLDGLALSGFDFRVDLDGNWLCLEMNPVPTFLPYEAATGRRIGDAVLDLCGVPPLCHDRISPLTAAAQEAQPASFDGAVMA